MVLSRMGFNCAVIFPHTLVFNAPAMPDKTALVLDALGLPRSAEEAVVSEATTEFRLKLGIEMRLGALGVPRDDLPRMAAEAHAIRRLLDNNPRDLPREEILRMYETAF